MAGNSRYRITTRSERTAPTEGRRAAAERNKAAACLGRTAEQIAARFLAAQGFHLVHRNFRRRVGELDLIARRGQELIIAEVRTRSSETYASAAASVDWRKQRRMIRTTALLLQVRSDLAMLRVRFDVIVIRDVYCEHPDIEWIQHAF